MVDLPLFSFQVYLYSYIMTLLLGAYIFKVVIFSWEIELHIIISCLSLSLVIVLILQFDTNIATPSLFCLFVGHYSFSSFSF